MRKIAITLLCSFLTLGLSAQSATEELQKLLDEGQYAQIIAQYADKAEALSAEELYYVGYAYAYTNDWDQCVHFMDYSIGKNPEAANPYYVKGTALNNVEKPDEALTCFLQAIALRPDNAFFYSGLGGAYSKLRQYDLAYEAYMSCLNLPDGPPDALFNAGLMAQLSGKNDKAEDIFLQAILLDPNDYHSYAKLIQVYYHREAYDQANPYRQQLYDAYKNGALQGGNLADMFCFDQFDWQDKHIQVFERFQEGRSSKIYYKQIFFILNGTGQIEYTIQTEYSPTTLAFGGPPYLLCRSENNGNHINYGIGIPENASYKDLKQTVISVLEGKATPAAAFILNNKKKKR